MTRRLSFTKKLLISYVLIISIIIFFTTSYLNFYATRLLTNQYKENLYNLGQSKIEQLDLLIKDMDKTALQVVSNSTIRHYLYDAMVNPQNENYFDKNLMPRLNTLNFLSAITSPNIDNLGRISIYNAHGDYINLSKYYENFQYIRQQLKSDSFKDLYDTIDNLNGKHLLVPPSPDYWNDKHDDEFISLYREIRDLEYDYGVVEIQQPYKTLDTILKTSYKKWPLQVILLTDHHEIAYSSFPIDSTHTAVLSDYYSNAKNHDADTFTNPITKRKEFIMVQNSSYSNWTLFFVMDYNKLTSPIKSISQVIILVSILIFLLSLLIFYIIVSKITRPLNKLYTNIVTSNNQFLVGVNTHASNELVEINSAFNNLINNLNHSLEEIVILKDQQLDAQFLALQSQMNPHFLFNSLSLISSTALDYDNMKTYNMCTQLSQMLHYNMKFEKKLVSLKDELDYAHNYLNLMKGRLEDGFVFHLHIIGEPDKVLVPKLIIQPFIENAFKHAFQNAAYTWTINLWLTVTDDRWSLVVEDNGCGFPPAILTELNAISKMPSKNLKNLSLKRKNNIGILNILCRLNIVYQGNIDFKIENLTKGCKIYLGGPKNV